MESNNDLHTDLKVPEGHSVSLYLKSWERRLRGCQVCGLAFGFLPGKYREKSYNPSLAELELGADRGCHRCFLLRDALRHCIPNSELSQGRLGVVGTKLGAFHLYWRASNTSEAVGINIFTLKVSQGDLRLSSAVEKRLGIQLSCAISGDTSSESSWQWAMDRLQQCKTSHRSCGLVSKYHLPTRVLDVGTLGGSIRLYQTQGEIEHYIALSHCWGKSRILTTTTETLEKNIEDILWDSLAKTFQDAVQIVRKLGLKYLWIDSLCIIQDDDNDWSRESGKMATIYQHAYLTIAATKSSSGKGGLFSIASQTHLAHALRHPGQDSGLSPVYTRVGLSHPREGGLWNKSSKDFPLMTRAWTYQEIILSARIIHFASNELIWECREKYDCECDSYKEFSSNQGSQLKIDHARAFRDSLLLPRRWRSMVVEYSSLNLTFGKDKLPALSGLAKEMQKYRAGRYLAGMWESDLLSDLLWRVTDTSMSSRCCPWRAPSWSWVSVEGIVAYDEKDSPGTWHFLATVIEVECIPAGLDTTGAVSSGHLVISGKLIESSHYDPKKNQAPNGSYNEGEVRSRLILDFPFSTIPTATAKSDIDIYLLEVGQTEMWERMSAIYLVLNKLDTEPDTYQRVGLEYVYGKSKTGESWEQNIKNSVVRII